LGEAFVPQPMVQPVPMMLQKLIEQHKFDKRIVDLPIFLPHILFSHYFNTNRSRFDELYLGRCATTVERVHFWRTVEMRGDPRLQDHPMKKHTDWMSCTIPLALHGDGVPVIGVGKPSVKSLEVLSFQSIFTDILSSMRSKQLISMMFSKNMCTDSELEVWRILLWSFHWLAEGVWPPVGWNFNAWPPGSTEEALGVGKKPLANGLRATIWSLKGDLDYFAKSLHLRHYNSVEPCDLCPANRRSDKAMQITNFGDDAVWQSKLYSSAEWLGLYGGEEPHPVFQVGSVSNLCLEPDKLHIMYLGTSQYMLGSALHIMVHEEMVGLPADNMESVWRSIVECYVANNVPVRFSSITCSSFASPKHYPRLKGKGAEIRDVVYPILKAWQCFVPATSVWKDRVIKLLEAQCDIQHTLQANRLDLHMDLASCSRLQRDVLTLLVTYQELAVQADAAGKLLWNFPMKFHWLWHLGQRCKFLNPAAGNTMIDEDFAGRMKTLTSACSAGSQLHNMSVKAMEKYRWAMHFMTKSM
jgi:hypothetical protein